MITPELRRQFEERFDEAICVDDTHWRCGGRSKSITRKVLKDLDISDSDQEEFLLMCESMGGKCCDCEIMLNVCAGENDTNLEIHHHRFVECESVVSVEDVHPLCKHCHAGQHDPRSPRTIEQHQDAVEALHKRVREPKRACESERK